MCKPLTRRIGLNWALIFQRTNFNPFESSLGSGLLACTLSICRWRRVNILDRIRNKLTGRGPVSNEVEETVAYLILIVREKAETALLISARGRHGARPMRSDWRLQSGRGC